MKSLEMLHEEDGIDAFPNREQELSDICAIDVSPCGLNSSDEEYTDLSNWNHCTWIPRLFRAYHEETNYHLHLTIHSYGRVIDKNE